MAGGGGWLGMEFRSSNDVRREYARAIKSQSSTLNKVAAVILFSNTERNSLFKVKSLRVRCLCNSFILPDIHWDISEEVAAYPRWP